MPQTRSPFGHCTGVQPFSAHIAAVGPQLRRQCDPRWQLSVQLPPPLQSRSQLAWSPQSSVIAPPGWAEAEQLLPLAQLTLHIEVVPQTKWQPPQPPAQLWSQEGVEQVCVQQGLHAAAAQLVEQVDRSGGGDTGPPPPSVPPSSRTMNVAASVPAGLMGSSGNPATSNLQPATRNTKKSDLSTCEPHVPPRSLVARRGKKVRCNRRAY